MQDNKANAETFKRKTCKRYNDPGHAHSLTFSCFQQKPFLSRDRTRRWLIDAINKARTKHEFDVWAYVIMPEHVHLLIYPLENYSISKILTTIKQSVSKRAVLFVKKEAPDYLIRKASNNHAHASVGMPPQAQGIPPQTHGRPPQNLGVSPDNRKEPFRFWQRGGGYDKNLWTEKYIWETIDYIHRNPVRRKLCATDTDWEWSSARAYAGLKDSLLKIDFGSLPNDVRRK